MKNIFFALALLAGLGATAQTKKAVAAPATTVVAEKLTAEAAAERDMKALSALIKVDDAVKPEVNKILITKYRVKEDKNLSPERMIALNSYVESELSNYIGSANFAKLKANTKLYNQVVK